MHWNRMAPLVWAVNTTNTAAPGAYDNSMPRDSWKSLKGKIPDKLYGRVTRAVAANDNSHVNLSLFAAALAAANAAHVDSTSLHICSATYLVSRVAYNLAYVFIDDEKYASLRSGTFWIGAITCGVLFFKAADKMKSLPW
ncbi:hypothetical protein BCR39DRAFT_270191 [Naematelia encephala]|uniref:Membrane-associated, eicosanoid/glutathione metabolism protein n=1 Tax=Naematelia encephala TaxID=71784 RepID=A0A1Y2AU77_9TREE|nr:hypothetical protein BCR39DRAFT_270191 [Naematelia encephala]